ncbi:hypothetical protein D3C72_2013040 [compost metagenome]
MKAAVFTAVLPALSFAVTVNVWSLPLSVAALADQGSEISLPSSVATVDATSEVASLATALNSILPL